MRVGVYYESADMVGKLAVQVADGLASNGIHVSTFARNIKIPSKHPDHGRCCPDLHWMARQDKVILFSNAAYAEIIRILGLPVETILFSRPYWHQEVRYAQQADHVVSPLASWRDELQTLGCRVVHIPYASANRLHRGKSLDPRLTVTIVADSGSIDFFETFRMAHTLMVDFNVSVNLFRPSRIVSPLHRYLRKLRSLGLRVIDSRRQHHYRRMMTYANSDLVVWPALSDTYGIVPIDAESCGTRVVMYAGTADLCEIDPRLNSTILVRAGEDKRYFRHVSDQDQLLLKRVVQEIETAWSVNSAPVSPSRSGDEMIEKWLSLIQ